MKTISKNSINGSEFIVKELIPETIFTPEDFSEEQILMKDSVKEFVDREIIAERSRFENKDYEYTKEVMQKAIKLNSLLESSSNGDNNFYSLLEQATISSFFNSQNFSDEKKSSQTLDYLLKRLNMIDSGWKANLIDMDFIFSKTKDKIKEDFVISLNSINQNKYYEFNKICETIQEHFLSPSKLILNDNEIEINTPRDLVSKGLELVKKGASVQRYKGLGEMNPDQLWETTLDPEFRSLLQVKIDDAQRADEIFEELMGDDVDKRKTFIQSNAKKVVNLDV